MKMSYFSATQNGNIELIFFQDKLSFMVYFDLGILE